MEADFSDRLLAAIARTEAPICVGIDPILESIPDAVRNKFAGKHDSSEAAIDAIFHFTQNVLKIVAPLTPIVKFQSAYFEKYRWEGIEAYFSLIQEAREMGLLVIGDVKRGDIGSTASAYAAGHLTDPIDDSEAIGPDGEHIAVEDRDTPDAITVNPMLGMDTLAPFIEVARENQRGLFVLVRTSNPGSTQLQDVKLEDGRTWSEMLADAVDALSESPDMIGRGGYSLIGAVVGATQPQTMQSLRQRLPRSMFLLPGYGAQGATADMTRAAFQDGKGAIISASRSILYAHKTPEYAAKFGDNWQKCVEAAVLDMKEDIARVIGG